MSAKQLIILVCDGPKCTSPGDLAPPLDPPRVGLGSAAHQREVAAERGWTNEGSKDYCGMCTAIRAGNPIWPFEQLAAVG